MAFWSTEKLKERLVAENLFDPYESSNVKNGAYELGLGSEAFITSDGTQKTELNEGKQLTIPPGQFGLLVTEERVTIPMDAIGFISIKASIKFRGLVNVSGFHVDPGFSGRLKFAVYNAGSQNIVLDRNRRVFLIWFSSLDRTTTDLYKGSHQNQLLITADDVTNLHGEVASPAALKKSIETLRAEYTADIAKLRADYEGKINGFEREVSLFRTVVITAGISLTIAIISLLATFFLNRSAALQNPVGQQSTPVAPAPPSPQNPAVTAPPVVAPAPTPAPRNPPPQKEP